MAAVYEYFSQYAAGKPAIAPVSEFSDGQIQVTAQATYARPAAIQTYVQQLAADPTVSRALDDIATNAELKAAVASYQSFKTGGAFQPDGWRTEVGPAVAKILATEPSGFRQIITSVNQVIESLEQQTSTAAAALASQSSASASATSNINGTATTGNGGGLSEGAKIGIGVGVGVGVPILIAIIVLILVFCCRKGAGLFGIGGSKAAAGATAADGEAAQPMAQASGPIAGSSTPYSGAAASSATAAAGGATGAGLGYGAGNGAGGAGGYNATDRGLAGNAASSGAPSAGQLGTSSASGSHGLAAAGAGAAAGLAGGYGASKAAAGHSTGQTASTSATAGQGSNNTGYASGAQGGSSTAYGSGANGQASTASGAGSRGLEGAGAGAAAGLAGGYGASKLASGSRSGSTTANTTTGTQGTSNTAYGSGTQGTSATGYNSGVDGTNSTAHGSGSRGLEAAGAGAAAGLAGGYGASKLASGSGSGSTAANTATGTHGASNTAYGSGTQGTDATGYNSGIYDTTSTAPGSGSRGLDAAGAGTAAGLAGGYGASKIASGSASGQTGNATGSNSSTTYGNTSSGMQGATSGRSELAGTNAAYGSTSGHTGISSTTGTGYSGATGSSANASELADSSTLTTTDGVPLGQYFAGAGLGAAVGTGAGAIAANKSDHSQAANTGSSTSHSAYGNTASQDNVTSSVGQGQGKTAFGPATNGNALNSTTSKTATGTTNGSALGGGVNSSAPADNATSTGSGLNKSLAAGAATGAALGYAGTRSGSANDTQKLQSGTAGSGSKTASGLTQEQTGLANKTAPLSSTTESGSGVVGTAGSKAAGVSKGSAFNENFTSGNTGTSNTLATNTASSSAPGKESASTTAQTSNTGAPDLDSSSSSKALDSTTGKRGSIAGIAAGLGLGGLVSSLSKKRGSKADTSGADTSKETDETASKDVKSSSSKIHSAQTGDKSSKNIATEKTKLENDTVSSQEKTTSADAAKTGTARDTGLKDSQSTTKANVIAGAPLASSTYSTWRSEAGEAPTLQQDTTTFGSTTSNTKGLTGFDNKSGTTSTIQSKEGASIAQPIATTSTEKSALGGTAPGLIYTSSQPESSTVATSKRDGLVTAPQGVQQPTTNASETSRSSALQSTGGTAPQSTTIVTGSSAPTGQTITARNGNESTTLRSQGDTLTRGKDVTNGSAAKALTTSDLVATQAPARTEHGSSSHTYWIIVNGAKRLVSRDEYEKFIAQQDTATTRQIVTSDGAQIAGTPSAIENITKQNVATEGTRSTDSSELSEAERIALASSVPVLGLTAGALGFSAISNKPETKEDKTTEPTAKEATKTEGNAPTQFTSSTAQSKIPKLFGSSKATTTKAKDEPAVDRASKAPKDSRDVTENAPTTSTNKRSSGIFGLGRSKTSKKEDVTSEATESQPTDVAPAASDKDTSAPTTSKRFSGIFGSSKSISKNTKDIPTDDSASKKIETVQTAPERDSTTVTKTADSQTAIDKSVATKETTQPTTTGKRLSGVFGSSKLATTDGQVSPANGSTSKTLDTPKTSPEPASNIVTKTTEPLAVASSSTAPEKTTSSSAIEKSTGLVGSDKSLITKARDSTTNGSTSKEINTLDTAPEQTPSTTTKIAEPQTVEGSPATSQKETSTSAGKRLSGIFGSAKSTTTKPKDTSTNGSTSKEVENVQAPLGNDPKATSSGKRSSGIFGAALSSVGLGSSRSKSPKDTKTVSAAGESVPDSAPTNVEKLAVAPTSSTVTTHTRETKPEQTSSSTIGEYRPPVSSASTIKTSQPTETLAVQSPENANVSTGNALETSRSVTGATKEVPHSQIVPTKSSVVTDKVDLGKLAPTPEHGSTVTSHASSTPVTVYPAGQVQSVPSKAVDTTVQSDLPTHGKTTALQQFTAPTKSTIERTVIPTTEEAAATLGAATKTTDSARVQQELTSKLTATDGKPTIVERGILTGQTVPAEASTVTPITKQDAPQSTLKDTTSTTMGPTAMAPTLTAPTTTAPTTTVPSATATTTTAPITTIQDGAVKSSVTEPVQPAPGLVPSSTRDVPSAEPLGDTSVVYNGTKKADIAGRPEVHNAAAQSSQAETSRSIEGDNLRSSESPAFDIPLSAITTGSQDPAPAQGLTSVSQPKSGHKAVTSGENAPTTVVPSSQPETLRSVGATTIVKPVSPAFDVPLSAITTGLQAPAPVHDRANVPQDKLAHSQVDAEAARSVTNDKPLSAGFDVPLSAISTGIEPKTSTENTGNASKYTSVSHVESQQKPTVIGQSTSNITRDLPSVPEPSKVDTTIATGQAKPSESTTAHTASSLDTGVPSATGSTTTPGSFPVGENVANVRDPAEIPGQAPRSSAPIDVANNRASVADTIGSSPSESSPWSPISNTFSMAGDRSSASSDDTQPSTAANSPLKLSSYLAGAAGALGMTGIAAAIAGEHEQDKKTTEAEQVPEAKDSHTTTDESTRGGSKEAPLLPEPERQVPAKKTEESKVLAPETPSVESSKPVVPSTPAVTEVESAKTTTTTEKQQVPVTKDAETAINESSFENSRNLATAPSSARGVPGETTQVYQVLTSEATSTQTSAPVVPSKPAVTKLQPGETVIAEGTERALPSSKTVPEQIAEPKSAPLVLTSETPSTQSTQAIVSSGTDVAELHPEGSKFASSNSKALTGEVAKLEPVPAALESKVLSKESSNRADPSKSNATEFPAGENLATAGSELTPTGSKPISSQATETRSAPKLETDPFAFYGKTSLTGTQSTGGKPVEVTPASKDRVTAAPSGTSSAPRVDSVTEYKPEAFGGGSVTIKGSEGIKTATPVPNQQTLANAQADLAAQATDSATAGAKTTTPSATNQTIQIEHFESTASEPSGVATWKAIQPDTYKTEEATNVTNTSAETTEMQKTLVSKAIEQQVASGSTSTGPSAGQAVKIDHYESTSPEATGVATWKVVNPNESNSPATEPKENISVRGAGETGTTIKKLVQGVESGELNLKSREVITSGESTNVTASAPEASKSVQQQPATFESHKVLVPEDQEETTATKTTLHNEQRDQAPVEHKVVSSDDANASGVNTKEIVESTSATQEDVNLKSLKSDLPKSEYEQLTAGTRQVLTSDKQPGNETVLHGSSNLAPEFMDQQSLTLSTREVILPEGQSKFDITQLRSILSSSELSRVARGWYTIVVTGVQRKLVIDTQREEESYYWQDLHNNVNMDEFNLDVNKVPAGSASDTFYLIINGEKRTVSRAEYEQFLTQHSASSTKNESRGVVGEATTVISGTAATVSDAANKAATGVAESATAGADASSGYFSRLYHRVVDGQQRSVSHDEHEKSLAEQDPSSSPATQTRDVVGSATATLGDAATSAGNAASSTASGVAAGAASTVEAGSGYLSGLYHIVVDGVKRNVSQDEYEKHVSEQGVTSTQSKDIISSAGESASETAVTAASAASAAASNVAVGAASTAEAGSGYLSGLYHIVVDGVKRNVSQDEYEKHVSEQGATTIATQARDLVSNATATVGDVATSTGSAATTAASGVATSAASTAQSGGGFLSGLYHIIVDGVQRQVTPDEHAKIVANQQSKLGSKEIVTSGTTTTDALPNVSTSETYYIIVNGEKKAVSKAEYEKFVVENNSTSESRQVFSSDSKVISDVDGVTPDDIGNAADVFYISIDGVKRSVSKAEYEKFISEQNAPVESRQVITSDSHSTGSSLDAYYLVIDGVKKSVSKTEYEQFVASQKKETTTTSKSVPAFDADSSKSESTYYIIVDGERRSVSKAEYDVFVTQNQDAVASEKKLDVVRDAGSSSSETFYISVDGVKRAVTRAEFDAFVAQNEGAVTSEEKRDVVRSTGSESSETYYIIVDGVKRAVSKADYEEFLASNKNASVISEPATSSETYYIEFNGEKRAVSKAEYEAFIASNKDAAVISEPSTASGTYRIEMNGEKRMVSKAEYEAFLSGNKNVFVTSGPSTSSGTYYIEINGEKRSVSKDEYEAFIAGNKDSRITSEPSSSSGAYYIEINGEKRSVSKDEYEAFIAGNKDSKIISGPSSSSGTYYIELNGERRAVSKAEYEAFVTSNKSVTTSSQHTGPSSSESYWIEINGAKRAVSKAEYEAFVAGQGDSLTTITSSSETQPLSVADLAAQLRASDDSTHDSSEVREIVTSGTNGETLIKKVVISSGGGSAWASEEAAVMDDEFRSSSRERKAPWESNDGPSVEEGNSWQSGGPSLFG